MTRPGQGATRTSVEIQVCNIAAASSLSLLTKPRASSLDVVVLVSYASILGTLPPVYNDVGQSKWHSFECSLQATVDCDAPVMTATLFCNNRRLLAMLAVAARYFSFSKPARFSAALSIYSDKVRW